MLKVSATLSNYLPKQMDVEPNMSLIQEKQNIQNFMAGCTVEVTPGGAKKIDRFQSVLKKGTTVYVTCLPGSDFCETAECVKRLRTEDMRPVPHLAARSIPSKKVLEENLRILQGEAGVDEILLVGGGVTHPAGEFDATIQILRLDMLQKYGISKIGVAGHPEGSPDIPEQDVAQALREKNEYARQSGIDMYIATQFLFEAAAVIEWDQKIRAEGNQLPIHIGIPGLATIKTLLRHAQACGVGASMRFLTRQAANIAKLMSTSAPDQLVRDLANYQAADPTCGIRRVHLYPLGGLEKSARWMNAVQEGCFELKPKGGFEVLEFSPEYK